MKKLVLVMIIMIMLVSVSSAWTVTLVKPQGSVSMTGNASQTITLADVGNGLITAWNVIRGNVTIVNDKFTMPQANVEIEPLYDVVISEIEIGDYVKYNAGGLDKGWRVEAIDQGGVLTLANDSVKDYVGGSIPDTYIGKYTVKTELGDVEDAEGSYISTKVDDLDKYCNETFGTGDIAQKARSITKEEAQKLLGISFVKNSDPNSPLDYVSHEGYEDEFWIGGSYYSFEAEKQEYINYIHCMYHTYDAKGGIYIVGISGDCNGDSDFLAGYVSNREITMYVFPMVITKPGLFIIGGTGTYGDPYVLSE